MITEVHQEGRFYGLSTGRAAHHENIMPHNPSKEDWCIPADMEEGDYLMMDPACEVNDVERAGFKCKPSKCEILRDSIKYLGRMVNRHGVRPDPEAVDAVLTWEAPRTDTQLLSFLGFVNYYREFIKGYADKVYPMQKLMRNKGKKFECNDEAQVAFENIKRELCEAPVLGMPTEKCIYVLDTDASVVAISGILYQEQEWNGRTVLRPIAYGSKVLSDTEMKYGAPKAEMFAVVTFV